MSGWSSFWRHPRIRELTLSHLIRHDVPERHQEWFARCQRQFTLTFPFTAYCIFRAGTLFAIALAFFPPAAAVVVGLSGVVMALIQVAYETWLAKGNASEELRLSLLRKVMLLRGALWSGLIAGMLLYAPEPALLPLACLAMVTLFIDAMTLIAIPRTGILASFAQSLAIAAPLTITGGWSHYIVAVFALLLPFYTHNSLFWFNYIFATRRLRTREMQEANETVQLLLNQYDEEGSDWLFECDVQGHLFNVSQRFADATGKHVHEIEGHRMSEFMLEGPERALFRQKGLSGQAFRDVVVPLDIEGERRWWSISGRPTFNRAGERIGFRGFICDVTKTRLAEEKVTYMAHYDVLTGLPNRSLFGTTLDRAFSRQRGDELLAVLFVDLDHFKAVNDSHGHTCGDGVLREAAVRLEATVPGSAMIARLGGDEFAVLLERMDDRETALKVAQSIVTAMDEPMEVDGRRIPIGASVGVAYAPDNGKTGDDLLRAADLALYDAKAKGRRGASLFDPGMQRLVQDRRNLELELRAALGRGELVLHYQPLMDAETGLIAGYEALLRWNHPERGMVSPAEFIPIAEECGQIVPIGAWVLREALMEAASWPEHLFVSVNLSPAQIKDDGIVNTIVSALAASGIEPSRLELEITETTLMQDSDETLGLLHRIRDLGVQFALDDFGTGYSSLNYLRAFPFDKIKIDRCFVRDLNDTSDSMAIVEAVIALANQLNMRTTAEGVESEDQRERLRRTGCNLLQGFLFSHALPANELEHVRGRPDTSGTTGEVTELDAAHDRHKPARNAETDGRPKRKAG